MKLDRLFEIVYILLSHPSTAQALAQRFGVSTRTIYRDVETLSLAGIPIYMNKGRGGGIGLMPEYTLNKAMFTQQEKDALLSSVRALGPLTPTQTQGALTKLSALLGEAGTSWIEVDFSAWSHGGQQAELFDALKAAILDQRLACFTYAGANGTTAARTVQPLKLCFKGQSWYLYAFCTARQEDRFFKLLRIKKLRVLDEGFTRSAPAKVLDGVPQQSQPLVTLTLKLQPSLAFRVYEEFEAYELQPDGSFIVQRALPEGEGMFQYLATFGDGCEVLEPAHIRQQTIHRLEQALARYRQG